MSKVIQVYLAGSVPKGDKKAECFVDWRREYELNLKQFIDCEII